MAYLHPHPRTPFADRATGALAAGIAVTALGWLLLWGLATGGGAQPERPTPASITLIEPRRPHSPPPPPTRQSRAKQQPSPPNLRGEATPVVSPVPLIQPTAPPMPIVVATRPNMGAAVTSGMSDRAGAGTGAAGEGMGSGGGGRGDGDGAETPPRFRHGTLKYAYLPAPLREDGAEGTVGVGYAIETDGRVGDCEVTASSGNAALDQATCRLIQRYFLYRPSRDAEGRPVRSLIEETHSWILERDTDPPPHP